MPAQVQVNVNAVERWSLEDVVRKRAISRKLLEMLIDERKYKLGAELVSGAADEFRAYTQKLNEMSRFHQMQMSGWNEESLESLLITSRSEIAYQQNWAECVLVALPADREADVLRAAFREAEESAACLLQAVELVGDQEARAHAYSH